MLKSQEHYTFKMHRLPSDFLKDEQHDIELSVFDYHTVQSSVKNKVILDKNAFSFLIEGNKEIYYGKQYDKLSENQFLMISAGNCLMTETTTVQNSYRSLLLFFDTRVLEKFVILNRLVIAKSNPQPYLVLEYDQYLQTFVKSLLDNRAIASPFLPNFLETKLFELLYYLISKLGASFLGSFVLPHSGTQNQFREIVENNSLKKLSLEELAFLSNMSLSTFKRQFKEIYHTSPAKWFLKQRLQFAAVLLSQQNKRPIEIYEELGFESLSSFIHSFKTEYGTTPRQFQQ
jgi:AraC-like DNA-binding protein